MATSPVEPSQQTTRARSIVTLDGYVSRGRAPPSSVPRDHSMLQDFAAYLELRLKSQNLSLLRRIFADFLNEQENTLVPMMQQACTIITIFPVLRTSAQRLRQAQYLLAKPKSHLDSRGCVFLYLQYRTATRNMALFKHLFLEFVYQRETALLQFVERGNEVISVIPYELRRVIVAPIQSSTPAAPPVQPQESPRAVEAAAEQQQQQPVESEAPKARKTRLKKRKRRAGVTAKRATRREASSAASPVSSRQRRDAASARAEGEDVSQRRRGRPRRVNAENNAAAAAAAAQQQDAVASARPERVANRRSRRISAAATNAATESAAGEGNEDSSVPPTSSAPAARERSEDSSVPPTSSAAAESSPARGRKPKANVTPGQDIAAKPSPARSTKPAANALPELNAAAEPSPARGRTPRNNATAEQDAAATPAKASAPPAAPKESLKAKVGRKRKAETGACEADKQKDSAPQTQEKSHKRGKPAMSEATCRSQVELMRKMEVFAAQIPWEAVYGNLPAPFDEMKYPELAKKFHRFWRRHSRAVWERHFWAPMSRKVNVAGFNKRNNRQISAKNAFETIIVAAYEQLGAGFFVTLDTQKPRHPGWWYRSPVVALFALQEAKGEDAVWNYVKNEALERFPDYKLPVPLKAPNYGAVRNCHKGDSDSMWMANHPLASSMLSEIAALKAGSTPREARNEQTEIRQAAAEPDREPENAMTVMEALGFT